MQPFVLTADDPIAASDRLREAWPVACWSTGKSPHFALRIEGTHSAHLALSALERSIAAKQFVEGRLLVRREVREQLPQPGPRLYRRAVLSLTPPAWPVLAVLYRPELRRRVDRRLEDPQRYAWKPDTSALLEAVAGWNRKVWERSRRSKESKQEDPPANCVLEATVDMPRTIAKKARGSHRDPSLPL